MQTEQLLLQNRCLTPVFEKHLAATAATAAIRCQLGVQFGVRHRIGVVPRFAFGVWCIRCL